ncbi:hypothetical protein [Streptacidiphilus carbonis]|uniref:hypothetical protein n=1 Tax=Streptacidiphilus carbonis TaxID=105422 RepID=UPI0006948C29|nr:hypothetical protein [Streptacidiphilus carbonis]
MAHPSRAGAAFRLRNGLVDLAPEVVFDPDPEGPPTALRTARRAWSAVAPGATHHLVLQDDAVPSAGFAAQAAAAAGARPDDALAFFTEWGSRTAHMVRIAALTGASWARSVDEYVPAPVLMLPAHIAGGFDEYAALKAEPGTPDDVVLDDYLRELGVGCYVSVPNLADHLETPSLTGNDHLGARRCVCLPAEADPPPDWTGPAVEALPMVPQFSWWEGLSCIRVRDGDRYRKEWTAPVLAGRGLGAAELDAACAAAVPAAVREIVSGMLIRQWWLTACALGMVAADLGLSAERVPAAARQPVAARALATMFPGGVRRFLPAGQFERAAGLMLEPLVAALCLGAQYGGEAYRDAEDVGGAVPA